MDNLIEVKGVAKKFSRKVVLDNVSLNIRQGKIFGIIGVSGSGKTTLLNTMVGFCRPSAGEVLYQGKKIDRNLGAVKKDFGFGTQTNSFYPKLTVQENLEYFGTLYGLDKKTLKINISRILPLLKLEDERQVVAENLSGGMQRRLDMACALVHYPKVLILDEPTEDLDPKLRSDIMGTIKQINKTGTTIIITSHLLWEMERLCDEVAILHNSSILKVGSVEELRQLYSSKEEVHVEVASGNYEYLMSGLNDNDVEKYVKKRNRLVIYCRTSGEKVLRDVLRLVDGAQDRINLVDIKRPSLNEIFAGLTTGTGMEKQ
ncbi:MAG: ABC transporter ATP-binding protein [Nanoarchaeota archaeon]